MDEIVSLQAELQRETIDHLAQTRSYLTPEQLEKLLGFGFGWKFAKGRGYKGPKTWHGSWR